MIAKIAGIETRTRKENFPRWHLQMEIDAASKKKRISFLRQSMA